jgi:hypothetical protein
MSIRRAKYLLFLSVLWPTLLISQQTSHQKKITGRVLAQDTGIPLAYAYLSVGGNKIGTLSNEKGDFILKVPAYRRNDTLQARHFGYVPQKIPLSDIGEDSLILNLRSQTLTLQPVEIRSISPKDTIRKSWRIREKNYEIYPTLIRGFYQEEMKDAESETQFIFAEGVLEIYKSPYHKKPDDRVRVLKGRQKSLPRGYVEEGVEYSLPYITQGPHLGILLDLMKDKESFVRKENLDYYEYRFEKVQYHNNRLTYIFTFSPNDAAKRHAFFAGKIYIDLESLAIVRANYEVTGWGLALYNRTNEKLELASREYEVNYMEHQGSWYLQDARVSNLYYFPPVYRYLSSYHTFLTTEIINEKIDRFPKKKALALEEPFVKVVTSLKEEFWEDYNFIPIEKE